MHCRIGSLNSDGAEKGSTGDGDQGRLRERVAAPGATLVWTEVARPCLYNDGANEATPAAAGCMKETRPLM